MSYRELRALANRIGNVLADYGVAEDDVVGKRRTVHLARDREGDEPRRVDQAGDRASSALSRHGAAGEKNASEPTASTASTPAGADRSLATGCLIGRRGGRAGAIRDLPRIGG